VRAFASAEFGLLGKDGSISNFVESHDFVGPNLPPPAGEGTYPLRESLLAAADLAQELTPG
jgi:hypothetical protein